VSKNKEETEIGVMGKIMNAVNDAKAIIATVGFIFASIIGGYNIITEYFVTKVKATELVKKAVTPLEKSILELSKQTKSNKKILVEMRMIRIESKILHKEELTPTEKRVYENLKKQYQEF